MDHLRIMGFLLFLLFTALFALQFSEARVLLLEYHFHKPALSQHNSTQLDAVAVASSMPGGHAMINYKESESNLGSNSENSTQYVKTIALELLQKEATPGAANDSKGPEGIKEVVPIESNAEILHEMLNSESSPGVGHMSVHGVEGNILSSSGNSPGVGHWQKSKTKYSASPAGRTTPNNVLSSGPSPGVGNGHTSSIAGSQSELGTFNKLPSGPSPGVGHKVINGNTDQVAQELESKKSAMIINKLPSGPSSGVGHSVTDGRNMMEKITIDSQSMKKTELSQESDSKRKSAMIMNILPSGPSPGVGNSATNGRNTMEKSEQKDEEGMGIQTFNKLPSGPSPGVGHSFINAHQPEKLERASEDIKGSDHTPILEKLPGGPSPGDGNSSINKLKPSRRQKQIKIRVEQSLQGLNRKIGCDTEDKSQFFGGYSFFGTPTPPMFGIAASRY